MIPKMIPTSLYIHMPWCIQKCPYCDFNSHKSPEKLPEQAYIAALLEDLQQDLAAFPPQKISSIFIGGGTPSLFSGDSYHILLEQLKTMLPFTDNNIEITLEANPGTAEQQRFLDYRQAGINRLSLGIQSFSAEHLKALGRIHDDRQAHYAIEAARQAGFDNINLDVMHGLPQQTLEEALQDLQTAIKHQPNHISWYQLTLEPNTVFYKKPPRLPSEEACAVIEEQGFDILCEAGYQRYEISAFAQSTAVRSVHNLNYWQFGDYYGIGAGAHSKLTRDASLFRLRKHRQPKDYLDKNKSYLAEKIVINEKTRIFEYMLNVTRLQQAMPLQHFIMMTGLPIVTVMPALTIAAKKGLITLEKDQWQVTDLGRRFTNDLQALFLPE